MKSILHTVKYFLKIDPPHTQTTQAERCCIEHYAKNAKYACEVGVYEGYTTKVIAETMAADGKLYAIDPFFKGRLGLCYGEWIAKHYNNAFAEKITYISKLSQDAIDEISESLDFLFIDADHSLEGITTDWTLYSKKVKANGIIALHDTAVPQHNPSVASYGSYQYFESTIKKTKALN